MAKKVSGGLSQVLKSSLVAWYRGNDGTRAYIEFPHGNVRGLIAVNGVKVMRLIDDGVTELHPNVQVKLLSLGIDLDHGWTCREEIHGAHINEAMQQSRYQAVRHHNGQISVQKVDEQRAVIFVNGRKDWLGKITSAHHVLEELGVETWDGWYPLQHNLLEMNESGYRYRRELI